MDSKTLAARLTTGTKHKLRVPGLVKLGEDPRVPVVTLHELCYDEARPALAFRAAWLLEYISVHHPNRFRVVADSFFTQLSRQRNPSCQRHFTNILRQLTHPKAPETYKNSLLSADRAQLVEVVFGWFVDPKTPVAVKANCMDILFQLRREFNWVGEELQLQIEFLLRDGSPAIQSRGKKVLAALHQSKPEVDADGQ